MTELLLGCGASRERKLPWDGRAEWSHLVTLDMNPDHEPDVIHDLASLPLPFAANSFDEIHAYDVMEHVGAQGDWRFFFAQWADMWRLLKPGGVFCGVSPAASSPWAWGDPGHTRIIGQECLVYLNQPSYAEQVGVTPMTDYRHWYKADFDVLHSQVGGTGQHVYVLRAVKPSRIGGGQ